LVPPMTYLQFLGKSDFESFWQFYRQFFHLDVENLSGYTGTLTPAHFWFVIFLFIFSVVALPLFLYLKRESGRHQLARLAAFFEKPGAVLLLALPPALVALLPDIGGKSPALYIAYFIYGYILMADARFQQAAVR
jgi:hypothetical protein